MIVAQNVSRAPSWITRAELARVPMTRPKLASVCAPVA